MNIAPNNETDNENLPSNPDRPSYSRGVLVSGAGTAINIVFLFLETVVAARLLSTDDLGRFVLLTVAIELLVMVTDLGSQTASIQLIASSDPKRQGEIANNILVFRVVLLIMASVLIYLMKDILLLLDTSGEIIQYIVYIPAMLIFASLDELLNALLQGFQAYHKMAVAQIVRSILRVSLSIIFLTIMDLGVLSLIYSWILSYVVSTVFQYLSLPIRKHFLFQQTIIREILSFGLPLQGMRVLWFISNRINLLLVSAFVGTTGVAYLNVAGRIPNALFRFAQAYVAVYFPTVTELLANNRMDRAHWMLEHSLRLLSFIFALGALIAVLWGKQFTTLLFSDKYAPSSHLLGLLMIDLHIAVIFLLMGYTLTAAGHPGYSLSQNIVRTGVIVIGNLLMIPPLGYIGSVYAGLFSYYFTSPICVYFVRRTGIRMAVGSLLKQTLLLWLFAIIFWWFHPTAVIFRISLVVLFILLNMVLSTISISDLRVVLSEEMAKRLQIPKSSISDSQL